MKHNYFKIGFEICAGAYVAKTICPIAHQYLDKAANKATHCIYDRLCETYGSDDARLIRLAEVLKLNKKEVHHQAKKIKVIGFGS